MTMPPHLPRSPEGTPLQGAPVPGAGEDKGRMQATGLSGTGMTLPEPEAPAAEVSAPGVEERLAVKLRGGGEYVMPQEKVRRLEQLCPDVDIRGELKGMICWLESQPGREMDLPQASLLTLFWMLRAQCRRPGGGNRPGSPHPHRSRYAQAGQQG